jgi:hypothetical protein
MFRTSLFAIVGLAASLALSPTASATEKQCDFQSDIVALSDYVLKHRAGLPRFKAKRYGAVAAYLKLRYQKPKDSEIEALLVPLAQARVARADELLFAWAIHTYGTDAATAIVGPEAADTYFANGHSPSVLRAAIVKDGIAPLATELRKRTPEERFRIETKVPLALLDKFDTYKSELARQAEAEGLPQIAAGLVATQTDAQAWDAFAKRVEDKAVLQRALSYWYWTPALVGNPPLKRDGLDPQWNKNREQIHRVLIAGVRMPERDFLGIYLNYSGKGEEASKVADTIITIADDSGGEAWTMDRAWITAYLDLLAVSADPTAVDAALKSTSYAGLRHYYGSFRDVLDWMMAVDALKPYLLKTSAIKARPELISADFSGDWTDWQKIADAIRNEADLAPYQVSPNMQAIAAELLLAAEKPHALAAFITAAKPDDKSVNLAEDFANRLDRICYGYLNFPAEAATFPDTPLFRFD